MLPRRPMGDKAANGTLSNAVAAIPPALSTAVASALSSNGSSASSLSTSSPRSSNTGFRQRKVSVSTTVPVSLASSPPGSPTANANAASSGSMRRQSSTSRASFSMPKGVTLSNKRLLTNTQAMAGIATAGLANVPNPSASTTSTSASSSNSTSGDNSDKTFITAVNPPLNSTQPPSTSSGSSAALVVNNNKNSVRRKLMLRKRTDNSNNNVKADSSAGHTSSVVASGQDAAKTGATNSLSSGSPQKGLNDATSKSVVGQHEAMLDELRPPSPLEDFDNDWKEKEEMEIGVKDSSLLSNYVGADAMQRFWKLFHRQTNFSSTRMSTPAAVVTTVPNSGSHTPSSGSGRRKSSTMPNINASSIATLSPSGSSTGQRPLSKASSTILTLQSPGSDNQSFRGMSATTRSSASQAIVNSNTTATPNPPRKETSAVAILSELRPHSARSRYLDAIAKLHLCPEPMGIVRARASEFIPSQSCMIDLRDYQMGHEYALAFSESFAFLPGVESINLSNNRLDDQVACQIILNCCCMINSNNGISGSLNSNSSFPGTGGGSSGSGIQQLDFSQNALGRKSCAALCRFVGDSKQLMSLNLAQNCLKDAEIVALCDALQKNSTLLRLDLSENKFAIAGMVAIGRFLEENARIEEVYLGWNQIRGVGALRIVESLKFHASLRVLDLSWNALDSNVTGASNSSKSSANSGLISGSIAGGGLNSATSAGSPFTPDSSSSPTGGSAPTGSGNASSRAIVTALGESLANNKVLAHLDISNNHLDEDDCLILSKSLEGNHSLIGLHMAGNVGRMDSRGFLLPQKSDGLLQDQHKHCPISFFELTQLENAMFPNHLMASVDRNCWYCGHWSEYRFTFPPLREIPSTVPSGSTTPTRPSTSTITLADPGAAVTASSAATTPPTTVSITPKSITPSTPPALTSSRSSSLVYTTSRSNSVGTSAAPTPTIAPVKPVMSEQQQQHAAIREEIQNGLGVRLHLSIDDWRGVEMEKRSDGSFVAYRILPPCKTEYFFTCYDPNEPEFTLSHHVLKEKRTCKLMHHIRALQNGVFGDLDKLNVVRMPRREGKEPCNALVPRTSGVQSSKNIKWDINKSVFAGRRRESLCRSFIDTDTFIQKAFSADWKQCKIDRFVKDPIRKRELEAIMTKYYRHVGNLYRKYCGFNVLTSVPTSTLQSCPPLWANQLQTDLVSVPWCGYVEFVSESHILDEASDYCRMADLENIFVAANLELTQEDKEKDNPDRSLTRFEFLECIVRIAINKYFRTNVCESPAKALEKLLVEHLMPLVPEDPNDFRTKYLYNEEVSNIFADYIAVLQDIYVANMGRYCKPGEKKGMQIAEFLSVMEKYHVFTDQFRVRDCKDPFLSCKLIVMDEMTTVGHKKLFMTDFMELLLRVSVLRYPPSSLSVTEVGKSLQKLLTCHLSQHDAVLDQLRDSVEQAVYQNRMDGFEKAVQAVQLTVQHQQEAEEAARDDSVDTFASVFQRGRPAEENSPIQPHQSQHSESGATEPTALSAKDDSAMYEDPKRSQQPGTVDSVIQPDLAQMVNDMLNAGESTTTAEFKTQSEGDLNDSDMTSDQEREPSMVTTEAPVVAQEGQM